MCARAISVAALYCNEVLTLGRCMCLCVCVLQLLNNLFEVLYWVCVLVLWFSRFFWCFVYQISALSQLSPVSVPNVNKYHWTINKLREPVLLALHVQFTSVYRNTSTHMKLQHWKPQLLRCLHICSNNNNNNAQNLFFFCSLVNGIFVVVFVAHCSMLNA